MNSLRSHRVYQEEPGRVVDDGEPVPDVLVAGLHQAAGPLQEYNCLFKRFQARLRRMTLAAQFDQATTSSPAHTPPLSSSAVAPTPDMGTNDSLSDSGGSEASLAHSDNVADSPETDTESSSMSGGDLGPLWDNNFGHAESLFTLEEEEDIYYVSD